MPPRLRQFPSSYPSDRFPYRPNGELLRNGLSISWRLAISLVTFYPVISLRYNLLGHMMLAMMGAIRAADLISISRIAIELPDTFQPARALAPHVQPSL